MKKYPGPNSIFKKETYPLLKTSAHTALDMQLLEDSARQARSRDGDLWMLQQRVFAARMAALKEMIAQGYQPVDDPDIHIEIHVEHRCVSDEAGNVGRVPKNMRYVTVLKANEFFND